MKYALAFIASFLLVASVTTVVRINAEDPPKTAKTKEDKPESKPKKDDKHKGHDMGKKTAEDDKKESKDGDKHKGHDMGKMGDKDDKKEGKEKSEWDADVKVDLKNKKDPVNKKEVGESTEHVVYHGFKVHFAEAKSIKKFKRRPIQYLVALSLEKTKDGEVKKVDPADFKDSPTIPDVCPMMGGDIFPDEDVYIFHRGYKIYFCCWNGCADKFLKDPSKHYATYGLKEKDGKLVAIEDKK